MTVYVFSYRSVLPEFEGVEVTTPRGVSWMDRRQSPSPTLCLPGWWDMISKVNRNRNRRVPSPTVGVRLNGTSPLTQTVDGRVGPGPGLRSPLLPPSPSYFRPSLTGPYLGSHPDPSPPHVWTRNSSNSTRHSTLWSKYHLNSNRTS